MRFFVAIFTFVRLIFWFLYKITGSLLFIVGLYLFLALVSELTYPGSTPTFPITNIGSVAMLMIFPSCAVIGWILINTAPVD